MHIDATFDGGNIEVVHATDPSDIQLSIRPDPTTQTPDGPVRFYQWFCFRVAGARGVPLRLRILNAKGAAYADGWPHYQAATSTDGTRWTRTRTRYEGGELVIEHTPTSSCVWFSYFAPYPLTRVHEVTARAAAHPKVQLSPVGRSLDGRSLDRLIIGDARRDLPVLWVIARQHPGETMASFWMEGFLDALLDPACGLAASILDRATLHVVPHMNPDGGFRGHLRTNAAGANLNREWASPSAERSPEVLAVRDAMDAAGLHFCLDVHGDEALPYTFIAGAEGTPTWGPRLDKLQTTFCDAYERANPDFQQVHGYPPSGPGQANLTMCTNQLAARFDALSMTLEMPFKHNADRPDALYGFGPQHAIALGRSVLHPIAAVVDRLRQR